MSGPRERRPRELLGVQIDALTIPEAVDAIVGLAGPDAPSAYVVKAHVEFLDSAWGDEELRGLLNGASLCLADGVAVAWAAHYLYGGRPGPLRLVRTLAEIVVAQPRIYDVVPERIGGINLTWPLLRRCAQDGLRVYLVGSPKGRTIEDTAAALRAALPGLVVAGCFPGELDAEREAPLAASLRESRPDVVLVGIGFPAQERLMATLRRALDHGVLIGEGGSFDYRLFGGRLARAPGFVQAIGLEWLWRLAIEPWRIRRQMAIPRYVAKVFRSGRSRTVASPR